jgi:hypothetical protein
MKTQIKLRNKLTGLYYVEGKAFTGTESEASIYDMNSPSHLVINHTFDNVEDAIITESKMEVALNKIRRIESEAQDLRFQNRHAMATRKVMQAYRLREKHNLLTA